jgi:hypothetical protein
MVYCWIVHLLSLLLAATVFALGYMGRMLKQRRRIDFAFKLQKMTYICLGVINAASILIIIFGNLYVSDVKTWLKEC